MIAAEDFTFPVIRSTSSSAFNLALLPPLWRISDNSDSNQSSTAGRHRRTFANQIFRTDESDREAEADAESQEKMDLLWEDFNEELQSTAASSDSGFSEETIQHRRDELETLKECANVRELKLIRPKPKMGSLVKVMKKLFSPQNTVRGNQQKRA